MKTKIITLLILLLMITVNAQNAINYKAVIKNNLGNVVANQQVAVQFTILQGVVQTNVYQETHNPITDANGIVIVNIGEGTTSDDFSSINWGTDDHFLNVQINTGAGLVDLGTTKFMAVPYALSAANVSGLEALDEGSGIGYRLKDTNPIYYGNIGDRAVDISYGGDAGYDAGQGAYGTGSVAMGQYTSAGNGSVAMGYNSTASGQYATAMGNVTTASGLFTTTAGFYTTASASYSAAFGTNTIADDQYGFVIGKFNDNTTSSSTLFQIGNGTSNNDRENAFVVDSQGVITAPSFDIAEIIDDKALITKEYADANYSGGGSGSAPTGLETLDEGNGVGRRLVGSDPSYYGNIGSNAVDLSFGGIISDVHGATGEYATALGVNVEASGFASNAMGIWTNATGDSSTAMGYQTTASGQYSTALGNGTTASGQYATAMGWGTTASGSRSTAMGQGTVAEGFYSTAMGLYIIANSDYSTVIGKYNDNTISSVLFQVGNGIDEDNRSNAFNISREGTITAPSFDISEITDPKSLITKEYADANYSGGGSGSAPTGLETLDEGNGVGWRLVGRTPNNYGDVGLNAVDLSISFNDDNTNGATGAHAFAVGYLTNASGNFSTAIGTSAIASSNNSVAIGNEAEASGQRAVALGNFTTSSGFASTAIGNNSTSSGRGAFSTGTYATAIANEASSLGHYTIADDESSTVVGRYNNNLSSSTTLFQVGNGSGIARSNAFVVEGDGSLLAPSLDISEINSAKSLVTKEYLDANSASGIEAIDEGNGIGWRLVGMNPSNYGNIGLDAIDLSISNSASSTYGATAVFSTALGYKTTASQGQSTAMGAFTVASGNASTAMGYLTTASNAYATAIGNSTVASGQYSTALGHNTEASGYNATAFGINTQATGYNSTAMGIGTIASTQSDLIIGEYNVDYTGFQGPIFAIGNGTSNSNRSNAFSVDIVGNAFLAGSLAQNSDKRLKKDIEDLDYGLNEILELAPKAYNWKNREQNHKSLGLIAQEVQPIINEIVHTGKDKDKTLSVSYTELIPVLIKAIQEQQEIIKQQNQTISNQEKINTEQTKLLEALLTRVEALENNEKVSFNKRLVEN